jgi:hypothetical protein
MALDDLVSDLDRVHVYLVNQLYAGRNDELDGLGHLADAVEDAASYLHNLKYTNGESK